MASLQVSHTGSNSVIFDQEIDLAIFVLIPVAGQLGGQGGSRQTVLVYMLALPTTDGERLIMSEILAEFCCIGGREW